MLTLSWTSDPMGKPLARWRQKGETASFGGVARPSTARESPKTRRVSRRNILARQTPLIGFLLLLTRLWG